MNIHKPYSFKFKISFIKNVMIKENSQILISISQLLSQDLKFEL